MAESLRYFFDEHMRAAIGGQLHVRGIEVLTTTQAGRANRRIGDDSQLAYATQMGRVLVSEDHHVVALHNTGQPHAGIVYFPVQLSVGACVESFELLALTTTPDEIRNQLFYGKS